MTIIETYELLKNRIGVRQSPDGSFVIDADNLQSDSGRYYQDEHTAITLKNLHATIDVVDADDATFNRVLADFRKQAVIHTVSNVFDGTSIRDLTGYVAAFDSAISLRFAIIALETMINSTRSNLTERILKNSNKWFYDLNGGAGNENFPKLIGIKDRYAEEIRRLRDRFNSSSKTLDSFTLSIGDAATDPVQL